MRSYIFHLPGMSWCLLCLRPHGRRRWVEASLLFKIVLYAKGFRPMAVYIVHQLWEAGSFLSFVMGISFMIGFLGCLVSAMSTAPRWEQMGWGVVNQKRVIFQTALAWISDYMVHRLLEVKWFFYLLSRISSLSLEVLVALLNNPQPH